ncbi:DUF294 nucleotidyltransferase-like domain-containing protein [Pseudoalteromonas sp. OOF1S-7]|uniref:DUF294 nucleotidyltransferase-like domain-containing protein n=1 Tax=Pseudoalteromonas sp. OOF1S-7 TaxID=2917757 RepID=UPI001EF72701|nr:DUF294 nucleotidyltransferase-like domain-containing protein [Pseudoalteromonas sp. OOF1S-7]MCG7536253.1 DUF294 nucleotidyltransferase-like domain-containing protein [Pseudoalteromonas sp. OOF1S-7]
MTAQVQDVLTFMQQQAPFGQLAYSATDYFVEHLEIIYVSAQNQTQWFKSEQPHLYLVRSGHFDLRSERGELITRLAEGDYFGYPSLLTGEPISNQLEVVQAGLVYVLPQSAFDFLRHEYKPFEQYFVRAHAKRLLSSHYKESASGWSEHRVSELMSRAAVTLTPLASIQEAAKVMKKHRVSSIMVTENDQLAGVVTDRDLRNRVLAEGLDPARAIREIMTVRPKYIYENNRIFSALHLMLKHNIHHLPVLNEDRTPMGMITSTDLLRQQKSDPVQLIGRIYKARSYGEVQQLAKEIPDLLSDFANKIEDISLIGQLLSGLSDALTGRLIDLYQQQHGTAPTPFAWICFGSQAREEQTLHSDQDNGLLLPEGVTDEQRGYFAQLGGFVCQQLDECGIRTCPGNIMASNPQCRGTLSEWCDRFTTWTHAPTPHAMLNCKIYFDLRFIAGSDVLFGQFLHHLSEIPKNELFYAAMAADINVNTVPIGLFQQFKLQQDKHKHKYLDLKKRGVVIINDIVRLYALQAGISKPNTLQRLRALKNHQVLSSEDIANLQDCWRFLTQLRLRTQIDREGLPENCINPEQLSSLERHQLKEAFQLVKQAQQACAFKFARGSL